MTNEITNKHDTDNPYGYRGFANRHSLMRSSGVTLIILGCALSSFASLLPSIDSADSAVISKAIDEIVRLASKDLLDTNFASTHVLATVLLIAFIIIGCWILSRAKDDLKKFQEAYPYLTISFTDHELQHYKTSGKRFSIAGMVIIILAIGVGISVHGFTNLYTDFEGITQIVTTQAITTGIILTFVAIGCWLLIRGTTLRNIPNITRYNYNALAKRNIYEMNRDSSGKVSDGLMHARKIIAHKNLMNRIFVIGGVIVALALYALPSLETPYFWITLVVAGVACKISSQHAYRKVCALSTSKDDLYPVYQK